MNMHTKPRDDGEEGGMENCTTFCHVSRSLSACLTAEWKTLEQ